MASKWYKNGEESQKMEENGILMNYYDIKIRKNAVNGIKMASKW